MGSTRPAATAADILAVLARGIPKGKALGYGFAINTLRRELRTSSKKAAEWLDAATREEPHEFELLGTVSGRAWHVSRGDGTFLRLDQAGYADSSDESYWPLLTSMGVFVSKDGDAGDREFVVLSKDLQAACKRASTFRKKTLDVHRRLAEAAEQGAEERHGQSLAYIRGLLKMAGIDVKVDNFRTAYTKSITGEYTSLNINLFDGSIDAVAEVLAANGIEPDPPTRIVTRKPLQEATE
jgi:hypothetical protein